MNWTHDYDFVCIGAGLGGFAGAVTAHEQGARAIIIEKSAKIGGVTALSQGQVWVPGNHIAAQLGIEDSWEEGLAYMRWVGGGYANEELAHAHCSNAAVAAKYFADHAGVRWSLMSGYPDYYWPIADGSRGEGRYLEVEPFAATCLGDLQEVSRRSSYQGVTNAEFYGGFDPEKTAARAVKDERAMGAGILGYFIKAAVDRQIPMLMNTVTTRLIVEDRRVTGIQAQQGGETLTIRAAKGVLLATGGYDCNADLSKIYDTAPTKSSWVPPSVTGDHMRLAGMLGAKIAAPSFRPQWVSVSFRTPGDVDEEGIPRWQAIAFKNPHAILVNRRGRRFCDESFLPSYVSALSQLDVTIPQLANDPFWVVFDSQHVRKYQLGGSRGKAFVAGSEDQKDFAELPWLVSRPSIGELADALGINGSCLESQIQRFNHFAALGEDPDFGRGSRPLAQINGDYGGSHHANLGTVSEAPFYGVRLEASTMGIPTAGLLADSRGRVIDWNDEPIGGLYVAGNSMAMLDLGIGYNSGNAAARGMTFGYLAAKDACFQ